MKGKCLTSIEFFDFVHAGKLIEPTQLVDLSPDRTVTVGK